MQIALVENGQVTAIGEYQDLFPETSFPRSGPNADFMSSNGAVGVSVWKPYDHATEQLVGCEPYLENDQVFTVRVETNEVQALSSEEIQSLSTSQVQSLTTAGL